MRTFNGYRSHASSCFNTPAVFQLLWSCLLLAIFSSCSAAPLPIKQLEGGWYVTLQQSDIGLVRTTMEFKTNGQTFEAYTRKNADKVILGGWTSMLGRTFTKNFKGGSLLRIEQGITAVKNDTLAMAGILTSALGSYGIKGYILRDSLYAQILNSNREQIGTLSGTRYLPTLPLEYYPALFESVLLITRQNIYNRKVLQTKEWSSFVAAMKDVAPKLQDDLEMVFAFFYYAGKLPFSHYALMKIPTGGAGEKEKGYRKRVFLSDKGPGTAYLKVTSFDGSAAEMDSVFDEITAKGYKNLIIDLRNNSGGSVEAGMALATRMTDTSFYGGVFLTQQWFNRHDQPPAVDLYATFPHFTEANYDLIIEGIHKTEGLCLKVVPHGRAYHGNVYILTNGRTASTCEPIVYGLRKNRKSVIIGEKTAGAMLNGEVFQVDEGFSIVIPTADYYTSDGFRLDKKGVEPDIRVNQKEALDYVLEMLE